MDFGLIEKHLRPNYYKSQVKKKMGYVGMSPQSYFQYIMRLDVNLSKNIINIG